jgi:hypothetical protein
MGISSRTLVGTTALAACIATATALAGEGASVRPDGLPKGSEKVSLDPANFSTRITNRYWPMKPGMRWVYRETSPGGANKRVTVTVTNRTKRVANGVTARIVRDTVTENGKFVEDTLDLYAQDRAGNVWYLGEDTKEYENGKVTSAAGSFEAGVDGAQAGIAMPAHPKPGLRYRQEYYAGEAEDWAEIVAVGQQAQVPTGHYKGVVMTRDLNPLDPTHVEYKFYAPGVGPVLAIGVSGSSDREELMKVGRVGS